MRNAKSVILTAVFAVIIIYLFAIGGYLFLQDDFLMEVKPKALSIEYQINRTDLWRKSFVRSSRSASLCSASVDLRPSNEGEIRSSFSSC